MSLKLFIEISNIRFRCHKLNRVEPKRKKVSLHSKSDNIIKL